MFKALLLKELRLVLRDRQALAALFIMPALFILIMAMALKDTFNHNRSPIRSSVVDYDLTGPSAALVAWCRPLSGPRITSPGAGNRGGPAAGAGRRA